MTSNVLRDYQELSINLIKEEFKKGNRKVLLWLATGAGKTTVFSYMIKKSTENQNKNLVLVRGRKLVTQASERLFREEVDHGILMANSWNYRPNKPNQVASIDTIIARNLIPGADLIIIDEADTANSPNYKRVIAQYPNAFIVAVTATPYVEGGLRHIADTIVHPITMLELIKQGYLVDFKYFAPNSPNISDVKISSSTKDYITEDLANVMESGSLTGDIVNHWKELAFGLPTLCSAVNVHHSKTIVERFNDSGVPAIHVDAFSTDGERNDAIRALENGSIKVVSNVGIMGRGVDIPCLRALIGARPTTSLNLFIQQGGRGTRPFPGKDFCIYLDHAGNIERHGLLTDEPEVDLDGRKKETFLKKTKICKSCFCAYRGSICPECGVAPPIAQEQEISETDGKLKELKDIDRDPVLREYKRLVKEAKAKSRKPAWASYKLIDKFGFEKAVPYLSESFVIKYQTGKSNVFKNSPYRAIDEPTSIVQFVRPKRSG